MRTFSDDNSDSAAGKPTAGGIEARIEEAVLRAIEASLRPYLHRLTQPEAVVFTAAQVASVLQVSEDTVWRLVKRGVLPRVPHLDGKLLIPKEAVNRLINPPDPPPELEADVTQLRPHRSRPRHTTGGP
jgi:excisionase family DNA binding protein